MSQWPLTTRDIGHHPVHAQESVLPSPSAPPNDQPNDQPNAPPLVPTCPSLAAASATSAPSSYPPDASDASDAPSAPPARPTLSDPPQSPDSASSLNAVALELEVQPGSHYYENGFLVWYDTFVREFLLAERAGHAPGLDPALQAHATRVEQHAAHLRQAQVRWQTLLTAETNLWSASQSSVTGSGPCVDGRSVNVHHVYDQVAWSGYPGLNRWRAAAREWRSTLEEDALLARFHVSAGYRLLAQQFGALARPNPARNGPSNLAEVRMAVSALFRAIRVLPSCRSHAHHDLVSWLRVLIGQRLQTSNHLTDTLFVLNHLLRCPKGVGLWGPCLISLPIPRLAANGGCSQDDIPLFDLQVTVLFTLCTPTEGRRDFVRPTPTIRSKPETACSSSTASYFEEESWSVLNWQGCDVSDPEGKHLDEADLLPFFNQLHIPACLEFCCQLSLANSSAPWSGTLRSLAMIQSLLGVLRNALITFHEKAFDFVLMRICEYMEHTLWTLIDLEIISRKTLTHGQVQHVQLECVSFFSESLTSVIDSGNPICFQRFSYLPLDHLPSNSLPQVMLIFYGQTNLSVEEPSIDLPVSVELPSLVARLKSLNQENRHHLFTAMTTVLKNADHTVSLQSYLADFVVLGYVTSGSFERYPELCTPALSVLAHEHPGVISHILTWLPSLGKDIDCQKDVVDMLHKLPIENWIPQGEDVNLLCERLLNQIHDPVQQEWTKTILDRIPWSSALLDKASREKVALIVVEVVRRLSEESSVTWNAAIWSNPTETSFLSWAWQILPKLKLHLQEQPKRRIQREDVQWGDYDQEARFHHLRTQVNQNNPVAAFVTLQSTQLGHSVPEICERGWKVLKITLQRAPVEAVLLCLFDMIKMFLACPADLVNNEDFQTILTSLLVGDHGLIQSAREITGFDSKSSVASIMREWILLDLRNRKRNEVDVLSWIEIWLLILTSIADWHTNRIILQVLNAIVESVFQQERPRRHVVAHFAFDFKVKVESEDRGAKIEGFTSWIQRSCSPFTFMSEVGFEFPWLACCLILAEECHPTFVQFCDQVVRHLDHSEASVDEAVRIAQEAGIEPDLNWTTNELPIYRWSKLFLAIPEKDLAVAVIAFQMFSSSFFVKTKFKESSSWMFVGPTFFSGFVNRRYFEKIKSKLMFCETQVIKLESKQLFQAFLHWISNPELLDPKVHIPSLPKNLLPGYLNQIVDQNEHCDKNTILWMDLVSLMLVETNSKEMSPEKKPCPQIASFLELKSRRPDVQKIEMKPSVKKGPMDSLDEHMAHLSVVDENISPFQVREILDSFSRELTAFVEHWNVLSDDLQLQLTRRSDLLAHLFKQEQKTVTLSASCPTSFGLKGPKYCSGPAQVRLQFDQWVQQDNVKQQLCDNLQLVARLGQDLEQRVLNRSLIATMTNIQALVNLLTSKTRLMKEGEEKGFTLGLEVIQRLVSILTEDWCRLPLVKHFFSTQLESLAESFLSNVPSQCLTLVNYLAEKPFLMSFLSSCFTPNVVKSADFITMYSKIVLIENEEHAFVLLSKISILDWYDNVNPSLEFRSDLIRIIGDAIRQEMRTLESNPSPTSQSSCSFGSLLLAKHEQNLHQLGRVEFPNHYFQILSLLLDFRQNQNVKIWFDFLHLQIPPEATNCKPLHLNSHPRDIQDYLKSCRHFMAKFVHYTERKEIDLCILKLRDFFDEERHQTGLNGIYSKYDRLYMPISIFIAQMSQFLLIEALSAQGNLESVWRGMWTMFSPWLCPIPVSEIRTAQWIQDLASNNRFLLPWTLEESPQAVFVADMFVLLSHDIGLECKEFTKILSLLWQMYCQKFALLSSSSGSGVKDHILEVIQAALIKLPWNTFSPTRVDFQLMVNLKDCDIMITHSFVGKIFTQIAWKRFLAKNSPCLSLIMKDFISVFLWVRFGPDFRQKNIDLLRICLAFKDTPSLQQMPLPDYKELLLLFVTRVDSKAITHIFDDESIDGNMIRFFNCSGGSPGSTSDEELRTKSIELATNILKLFDHCFKKYPKFIQEHKVELATGFQWLLALVEHQWKPSEGLEDAEGHFAAITLKEILLICLETNSNLAKFMLPELSHYQRSMQSSSMTKIAVLKFAGELTESSSSLSLATVFESCIIGLWETGQVKSWWDVASQLEQTWPTLDSKRDSMLLKCCLEEGLCKQLVLRTVLITFGSADNGSSKAFEIAIKWMRTIQLTSLSNEDFALLLWILLYLLDNIKRELDDREERKDEKSESKDLSILVNDLMGFLYAVVEPSHGYSTQLMNVFGLSTVSSFKPLPVMCLVFYSVLQVLYRFQSSAPKNNVAIHSNPRDPIFNSVMTSLNGEERYRDLMEWIQPYLPPKTASGIADEPSGPKTTNAPCPQILHQWFITLCQKALITNGSLFVFREDKA
ncbi:ectopic P granules protein 5 homolog [Tigriopus californicus]|uniref:ectopic P granules protein 5 homolog n=1 Tax=Tigriopus californicus TaxID=6832 RepID=UPI0027DA3242|nr:ectopic P granules protein 5 homolog [Tigriopus californicus]